MSEKEMMSREETGKSADEEPDEPMDPVATNVSYTTAVLLS